MDEIVKEFLAESRENLDRLDHDLVLLEQRPHATELLGSVFRTVHTLKGTSGMLGFDRLGALAHAGEGLLAAVRDGHVPLGPASVDALLRMGDATRELLSAIESEGGECGVEVEAVVAQLGSLHDDRPGELAAPVLAPRSPDPASPLPGEPSVRLDVHELEGLEQLVAELLGTRDGVARLALCRPADRELADLARRLDTVAGALHERVRGTRRQPVGHLWSRLPRIVRDLGTQAGKQVRVATQGHDTELDRALLDAVRAPLTHLVRNAVDHGLELPEVRLAAGKPAVGTVTLRALRGTGHVLLEVSDDGAGIDAERVAATARRTGVRSAAQLSAMSHAEVVELVLLPGISTATSVTTLSGRGVGMDVVRTDVERLGGTVEIDSVRDRGTTCRLRIPV